MTEGRQRKSTKFIDSLQDVELDDEFEEEEIPLHEGVLVIYNLMHNVDIYESPIDIFLPKATKLELPSLEWHHMDLPPKKVKLTNTGHTVILSGKWHQERPYLSGGPFVGNYVFSQLHFHWGKNNMEGSEHTIEGTQHPLEMHVVFFKSCYLTQESALKKKDGMCVIAFLFKLQDEPNPALNVITDAIYSIREPQSSTRLKSLPLDTYMTPFFDDYFLYSGSVNTNTCIHHILWLISRVPMGVSVAQIDIFRLMFDLNNEKLIRNFREIQPLNNRIIYHANPSGHTHSTLVILQKEINYKLSHRPQQVNKYPRSSKEYISSTGTTIYRAQVIHNPVLYQKYSTMKNVEDDDDEVYRRKIYREYLELEKNRRRSSRLEHIGDSDEENKMKLYKKYLEMKTVNEEEVDSKMVCQKYVELENTAEENKKEYYARFENIPKNNEERNTRYDNDKQNEMKLCRKYLEMKHARSHDEGNIAGVSRKILQYEYICDDESKKKLYGRYSEMENISEIDADDKIQLNRKYSTLKSDKENFGRPCSGKSNISENDERTLYRNYSNLTENDEGKMYSRYSCFETISENTGTLSVKCSGFENDEANSLASDLYQKYSSLNVIEKASTKVNIDPKILERMKLVDNV